MLFERLDIVKVEPIVEVMFDEVTRLCVDLAVRDGGKKGVLQTLRLTGLDPVQINFDVF